VQAIELLRPGIPDEGVQVSADAAAHWLDEAEGGVGSDGGIDGIAASPEDVEAGLGRERLAGGNHAARRHYNRAAGAEWSRREPFSADGTRRQQQQANE